MHDERVAAGATYLVDERRQTRVVVLLVHADAALHRHRNPERRDRGAHRGNAVTHQHGFAHQARAEATGLHAIGRAAAVEIDRVVTALRADPRRLRQEVRLGAAELQHDRMLGRIEPEQPLPIAMDRRLRGHHLGVQHGMRGQKPVEVPAMPVGPVHHRGNRKTQRRLIARFFAQIQ